jgi:proliferating cell nuclear antigen
MKSTERIIDIKTNHGAELKTLFEVLKDILTDTNLTFIKGNEKSKEEEEEKVSDSESDEPTPAKKRGRKPKKGSDKDVKNKKDKKNKDESDDDNSENDDASKKKKSKSKKSKDKSEEDDNSDEDSEKDVKKSKDSSKDKKSKKNKDDSSENEEENDDDNDNDADDDDDNNNNKEEKKTVKENNDETVSNNVKSIIPKNNGGIKILTVNDQKTLLLYVRLYSEHFPKFYIEPDEYTIGIDLIQFYNFFKSIDKEGIVSMYINKSDKQRIVVDVESDKSKTNYKLKLQDTNKKNYKIPPPIFDMTVIMETAEFHKICNEMSQISEFMGITCSQNKIEFTSKGSCSELKKVYENGKGVKITVSKSSDEKKNEPKIVQEIYELKNLLMFRKCVNLCGDVRIFLKNIQPLFIKYTIAALGEMSIGLSPVSDNEISKNANYDEKYDEHYDEDNENIKMKKA